MLARSHNLLAFRVAVAALALAGVAFAAWSNVTWPNWSIEIGLAIFIAAVLSLSRAFMNRATQAAAWIARVGRERPTRFAVAVAAIWFVLNALLHLAYRQPFALLWHDEHQFLLQTQMAARFRLWYPPHPLADFFDTFYVLMTPKYAPQSFPGTALMFVPTVWLHLPTWLMPMLVTAAAIGLTWWVIAEVSDPLAATMAAVMFLGFDFFRRLSTMYLAQMPLLVLGLLALVGWLQFRKSRHPGWAALIGTSLGWAAITRPLDAVCFGAIVGTAMLIEFAKMPIARSLRAALLIVACAAPFLAVQLVFDKVITGEWLKTPFAFYNERDQPALAYGAASDITARPISTVPQKQWFYDQFTMHWVIMQNDPAFTPLMRWRARLMPTSQMTLPSLAGYPFLFIGIAGLLTWRRLAIAALLPLFVLAYNWYPIFLFHYVAFALPAVVMLYGMMPAVAAAALPGDALRNRVRATLLLGGLVFAGIVVRFPPGTITDSADVENAGIRNLFARFVRAPAIVLYVTRPDDNLHYEPVYNDSTAWPDDAAIINAHDRGSDNVKLYAYYAARQPRREVWRYERGEGKLTRLGNVAALATPPPATHSAGGDLPYNGRSN